MKFCKGNTQKRILKHFGDLAMQDDGHFAEKSCEELSNELELGVDEVIKECHNLEQKEMLRLTRSQSTDGKHEPEKTKFDLLPAGKRSLETNWKQRIKEIIFTVGAILAIILAIKEFYPW